MGNGCCSGPTKKTEEDMFANEAKQNVSKRNPSYSPSLSRSTDDNEECNEAPIKQNKKIEDKDILKKKKYDDIRNGSNYNNKNNNNNNDKIDNVPDEAMNYINILSSSSHHIDTMVDADALKAYNDEEEDESISDLSEGFDQDGQTIDLQPQRKKSEGTNLLRFRSKAKWGMADAEDQEKELMEQIRRLSFSQGTKQSQ